MADSLEKFLKTNAFKTLKTMAELMDGDSPYEVIVKSYVRGLETHNSTSFAMLEKQLRAKSDDDSDFWGDFVFNFDNGRFERKTVTKNKLSFSFPSKTTGTKNNALLVIDYKESSSQLLGDEVKLPSSVSVKLTVDSKSELSASLTASYHQDGMPKKVSDQLTAGSFTWKHDLDNNQKKVVSTFEFKDGKKSIAKNTIEINGEFTRQILESLDDESGMGAVNLLKKTKNFYADLKLMDLGLKANLATVDKLAQDMINLEDKYDSLTEEDLTKETVKILNKHIQAFAYFVSEKKKFADVEFYVLKEWDDWWEEYDYYVQPRMILNDGSKMDMEEFADSFGIFDALEKIFDLLYDSPPR